MRSIFKYLLLFITSTAFAQDTCKVSGQIEDPKGDLQGMWLVHDGKQEKIPFNDGKWGFCGKLTPSKLYELVVEYKHNGHQEWFYWYVAGCIGISLVVYIFMIDTRKYSKIEGE